MFDGLENIDRVLFLGEREKQKEYIKAHKHKRILPDWNVVKRIDTSTIMYHLDYREALKDHERKLVDLKRQQAKDEEKKNIKTAEEQEQAIIRSIQKASYDHKGYFPQRMIVNEESFKVRLIQEQVELEEYMALV